MSSAIADAAAARVPIQRCFAVPRSPHLRLCLRRCRAAELEEEHPMHVAGPDGARMRRHPA